MFRFLILLVLLAAAAVAQGSDRAGAAPSATSTPTVDVPVFPNSTCPIMGKKVSMTLWADTELGRIYVCCKPCIKKVLAAVDVAHKTAYPVHELRNEVCPVSGEPIGKEAVPVTLQGYSFKVCCAACLVQARAHAQATLIKVTRPQTVDIGNQTCPVTGGPVTANALVVIDGALVRLSSPLALEQARVDPRATLAKAKAVRAKQQEPAAHQHGPKTAEVARASPEQRER